MLTRRQAGRGPFGFAYDDREREGGRGRERCLLGHSIADTFGLFGNCREQLHHNEVVDI
jgi:hypothetical protein